MVAFGGDEISALVIEIGSHSIKAGYSGEETPKVVVPSFFGVIESNTLKLPNKLGIQLPGSSKIYLFGDVCLSLPRPYMKIKPFLHDDSITDNEAIEALFQYIFKQCLNIDPTELPILLAEPLYLGKSSREKIVQILVEKFDVPGLYVGKVPILTGFSQGKSTCLVVDIGGDQMTVTPVVEGYVIKSSSIKQNLGGHLLTQQALHLLEKEMDVLVYCHYEIASKQPVAPKTPPQFTLKQGLDNIDDSFKNYMKMKIAEDFKESVCQIAENSYNAVELALRLAKYHEFPTGYNAPFLAERFRIPEIFFNPKECIVGGGTERIHFIGIAEMIQKCTLQCDVDVRAGLCNNLMLTGGSSLFPGFVERLYIELAKVMPTQKFKIFTSNNTYERKYAPWIGGSILTSLSSFQQMWISKGELTEHGPSYLEKRCHL